MTVRSIVCQFLLSFVPSPVLGGDVTPLPRRVLILVYHRFASERADSMTVRTSTFRDQLQAIDAAGYRIALLADVVRWHAGEAGAVPARAAAITVDDGHRSVHDVLRPNLARHPVSVTHFIYPTAISNASCAMAWDRLRKLAGSGEFDIESHTYRHPNLATERARCMPDDFRRFVSWQLSCSRDRLETETGKPVRLLAWPFGIHDVETEQLAAREGCAAAFMVDAWPVRETNPPMALPRVLMTDAWGARCMDGLLCTAGGAHG
ncbi:polysaccharide deacetylase family protein [Burkholderia sp. MSMB1498]|uniref:polysaccharide deacetylase family protein n=1 Tax=Burkholderia sp. MSMB1498 TaxID=1637842 RepID=UPI0007532BDF|nr:polysaccharide deacetylase [Burkholderia sp. MSMB1498]